MRGMTETVLMIVALVILLALAAAGIWLYMRRKYILYTEEVCRSIDELLAGEGTKSFQLDEDTLLSKTQMKLKRLYEITAAAARESEQQKLEVQGIVSDISHQLKTPVANVVMYCDTAMNPALSDEDRKRCMKILKGQVGKLEFLVQAMIRMSRLEQNMIGLHPESVSVRQLMENAAETIAVPAEKKGINVEVICSEDAEICCDEKWTLEALFNVLDNAVKYSPEGSLVRLRSERMEIYTKIQVEDEGMGISPEHVNDVCRRFYREEKAARTEGLGIGLYLTRDILNREKGYLKIHSEEGRGTTVSVYLLNAE